MFKQMDLISKEIDNDVELRLLDLNQAEEFFELVDTNREHISEWMFWVTKDFSLSDAENYLRDWMMRFEAGSGFAMGIRFKDKLAGSIYYSYIDRKHRNTEIGYWLGASFQGHGLIIRSCRALIDYAFGELRMHRVEIRCMSENIKSRRIPEKLGFIKEGRIRQVRWKQDHFDDHIVYGMLSDEWLALNTE